MRLGTTPAGDALDLDLEKLIGSHACVVANSGGGKSGLLRRILETTHGHIQHIVLDIEDEFYTLRERFDYVIAGGDEGDVPATVEGAEALARATLEHGFSLIVQLNDLGEDAPEFVGRFLKALVGAPRDLWRPLLVVIDEAHQFAPSEGVTAASAGVKMLTGKGRKRGFTAVIASQRISKLNADVRGDLNNWLLGRVGQTLDRNIMADQLGFTAAQGRTQLRMEPRSFWAFGPAIALDPVLFEVATVETTMVKSGQTKVATPPPPEALRAILAGLAVVAAPTEDRFADAGKAIGRGEAAELVLLRAEREEWTIERAYGQQQLDAVAAENEALRECASRIAEAAVDMARIRRALDEVEAVGSEVGDKPRPTDAARDRHDRQAVQAGPPATLQSDSAARPGPTRGAPTASTRSSAAPGETTASRKLIDALAKHYPRALPIEHIAKIAGVSMKSSQWLTNFRAFEASGLVKPFVIAGQWELTTAGRDAYALAGKPGDPAALLEFWVGAFPPSIGNMVRVLVKSKGDWLSKDDVADLAGVSRTSSALGSGLKELRDHGLAMMRSDGAHRAAEVLL